MLKLARLSTVSLALCACSGLSSQPSAIAPPAPAPRAHAAASQYQLFVGAQHYIEVYSFPGGALQSTIKTTATIRAMCSDSKGDVYATATTRSNGETIGVVYEVNQSGATLQLPEDQIPVDCASDPVTGNLAVTSYDVHNYAPRVLVYANASGNPKSYNSRALGANPQPAYDDSGDLFVTSGSNLAAILMAGKKSFQELTLSQTLGDVSHAQWDGKYFALQSFHNSQNNKEKVLVHVYRVEVSGKIGKVVGYSHFINWLVRDAGQSWIADGTLVATPGSDVVFWKYPAGGKAIKTIKPPHAAKAITITAAQ